MVVETVIIRAEIWGLSKGGGDEGERQTTAKKGKKSKKILA